MHIDEIKRGLRAEIKKREKEQYFTFQTNIRDMCRDVLNKLEEQEGVIKEMQDAPAVLDRMLDRLKDSAERYDEETRRKRVSDIHQYFLKRNMKIKILPPDVEIPDPPAEDTLYLR